MKKPTRAQLEKYIDDYSWQLAQVWNPPQNVPLLAKGADGGVWIDVYEHTPGSWQACWQSSKPTAIGEEPCDKVIYWCRLPPDEPD